MSDHNLAEALRTGLEAAQELLAIKREALGDDYRLTRTYWEAERELQAALVEAEQQAGEAVAWHVVDADGQLMHAAGWKEAAHEHINDALNEYGIAEAAKWRVIPVYTHPQQPLSDEQVEAGRHEWLYSPAVPNSSAFVCGVRFAERAHGITKDTK